MSRPPVAIVGMACCLPDAPDLDAYWRNVMGGHDAVRDVPPGRWDPADYYSKERREGTVYCKRGGYLGATLPFDPAAHGVMPAAVVGGEPDQFLALDLARRALRDAGRDPDALPEAERTEFVLGRGNYLGVGQANCFLRTMYVGQALKVIAAAFPSVPPAALESLRADLLANLLPLRPETAPSVIPNMATARTANRLNLMGANYTVDAACASSLIAVDQAVRDLQVGACDLALAGGAHVLTQAAFLSIFALLEALSPSEAIRPFSADADGLVPGEGAGIVVLRRLDDARRDGDRIYAVVRGVGTSSDGRGTSVVAPRAEGQVLAMRRAWEAAGLDPATLGLLEAHGTGTPVGDETEVRSMQALFGVRPARNGALAVGSVKSMIGHAMPAAGVAGLIKATLALHHKALPPTLHAERPRGGLADESSPLRLNPRARPWFHGHAGHPRRAAVSAFGFGGVNAHVVLEEAPAGGPAPSQDVLGRDFELALVRGADREDVAARAEALAQWLEAHPTAPLADVAAAQSEQPAAGRCLAVVASSVEDLRDKLATALQRLAEAGRRQIKDARGIYYADEPLAEAGSLAFLYPGEGSQHHDMLADLALRYPEVREILDRADAASLEVEPDEPPTSAWYYPPVLPDERSARAAEEDLFRRGKAQTAVIAANAAVERLLDELGVVPAAVAGHSLGELSALARAFVFDPDEFLGNLPLMQRSWRLLSQLEGVPAGAMLAVGAGRERVLAVAAEAGAAVTVANDNCPHQVVCSGSEEGVAALAAALLCAGVVSERLPYGRAYHTAALAPACARLREDYATLAVHPPRIPIWSCATAAPYPTEPGAVLDLAAGLWTRPVEFRRTILAMYEAGVRLFVEAGPRSVLTACVEDILRGRPHLAVAACAPRRSGVEQLCHAAGMLAAHGVPVDAAPLFDRRPLGAPAAAPASSFHLALDLPSLRVAPGRADALDLTPTVLAAALGTAGPLPDSEREAALRVHLDTMEKFLETERAVMTAWLGAGQAPPRGALLGPTLESRDGFLEASATASLEAWPFLEDHRFGKDVSADDPGLRPLAVVPLTVTLELVAEAAARLEPGLHPVELVAVRAHQWVSLPDDRAVRLRVRATRTSPGEAAVVVLRDDEAGLVPVLEAKAVLAATWPAAPAAEPDALPDAQSPAVSARQLYDGNRMFHGPAFQAVASLDSISPAGLRATLETLPRAGRATGAGDDDWLLDPFVLDAAGQVFGYWPLEHLPTGYVVFPIGLERLRLYGPAPAPGETLECRVRIRDVEPLRLTCDIVLVDREGRVRVALDGWTDGRFTWTAAMYEFWRDPSRRYVAETLEAPPDAADGAGRAPSACALRAVFNEKTALWNEVWARLMLSRDEQAQLGALAGGPRERVEWLAARTAGKEAARRWLERHFGLALFPCDVPLAPVGDRGFRPGGTWLARTGGVTPDVAVARSDDAAVAVAAGSGLDGDLLLSTLLGKERDDHADA